MTDALTGRALLTAVLAFLVVLSTLAGVGTYVTNVLSSCEPTDSGHVMSQFQAYHSEDGCELSGTATSR